MIKGSQIDKGLDRRTRLPFGLRRAVELADLKTEPAPNRKDAAAVRIHDDERARYFRDLTQRIAAGVLALTASPLAVVVAGSTITTSPAFMTSKAVRG